MYIYIYMCVNSMGVVGRSLAGTEDATSRQRSIHGEGFRA